MMFIASCKEDHWRVNAPAEASGSSAFRSGLIRIFLCHGRAVSVRYSQYRRGAKGVSNLSDISQAFPDSAYLF